MAEYNALINDLVPEQAAIKLLSRLVMVRYYAAHKNTNSKNMGRRSAQRTTVGLWTKCGMAMEHNV